jgi:Telomere repeat binding factor (TRF)
MDPVLLGGIYDYGGADNKMQAQQPDRAPSPMSNESSGYGQLFGQYWTFVQGSIAHAGVPLSQNGSYVSPYCAPNDPYFPSAQDNGLPSAIVQDMQQNGGGSIGDVNGVGEGMYNPHHRDSGYESIVPQEASMYPTQIDANGWQYPTVDPNLQLQSISLLDDLANQILRDMISPTVQDFQQTVTVPDTARGQAHATLQALFEQNKKGFSRDHLFITSSDSPQYSNPAFARTFRKANLATFVSCIFRGQNVQFLDLDDAFLELFMPLGTRLFKSEAALFLELKTQAYIAIMLNTGAAKEEVLDRLFPRNLQLSILRRRAEPTHLAPSESDFIHRLNTRRQYLSAGSETVELLQQLPHKYLWKDFLDEVVNCVRRSLESMDAIKVGFRVYCPHLIDLLCLLPVLLSGGPPSHAIGAISRISP